MTRMNIIVSVSSLTEREGGSCGCGCGCGILTDALIQGLDLFVVAVEQLHETGLRSGRSLDSAHRETLDFGLYPLQIDKEVLAPQCCALPHGGELSRLVVGEAQGGHVRKLLGEGGQHVESLDELPLDEEHRVTELHDVGVIANVAGSGAKVDDWHRLGSDLAESVDVPHDIVAEFTFVLSSELEVDVEHVVLPEREEGMDWCVGVSEIFRSLLKRVTTLTFL